MPCERACDVDDSEKADKLATDLDHFWRDLLPVMDSAADTSSLHNVARLTSILDKFVKQQSPVPPDGAAESKVLINRSCSDDCLSIAADICAHSMGP